MYSDEEDEDLNIAIALSLADKDGITLAKDKPVAPPEKGPTKSEHNIAVVDLCGDSDLSEESDGEIDLDEKAQPSEARRRKLSINRMAPGKPHLKIPPVQSHPLKSNSYGIAEEDTTTTLSSLQSMDRKKMEQERPARLKRKVSISPPRLRRREGLHRITKIGPGLEGDSTASDGDEAAAEPKAGPSLLTCSPTTTLDSKSLRSKATIARPTIAPPGQATSSMPGIQYPYGVVKKTWAYGFPRSEDIKIEEVLQKNDLNIAVLSAFQWDVEWLLRKLDLKRTKMIFVMQAKDDATVTTFPRNFLTAKLLRTKFGQPGSIGRNNNIEPRRPVYQPSASVFLPCQDPSTACIPNFSFSFIRPIFASLYLPQI